MRIHERHFPSRCSRRSSDRPGPCSDRASERQPPPKRTMQLSGRPKGERALLTASGQGIGAATARAFAAEGAQVYACDLNDELLQKLAAEIPGIHVRKLDVRDT